jgi:energy-coupling factor transport system ATP-binding protein
MKLSAEDVRSRVRRAMESLGLGFEEFKDRMTLGLSGGQRRRVALAGVLALEPELLILDEPTAGLDPEARRQLMAQILQLHDAGVTLVIVSHNMEELAEVCDRIIVLAHGRTLLSGTVHEVFADPAALHAQGLDVPDSTEIVQALMDEGVLSTRVITNVGEAVAAISTVLDDSL